jgi:hypothetical protein
MSDKEIEIIKETSYQAGFEDGLKNRDDIIKKLRSSLKKSDEIIKKLQAALDARAEFMSKSGDMDHKIVKSCEVLKKLESIKGES